MNIYIERKINTNEWEMNELMKIQFFKLAAM